MRLLLDTHVLLAIFDGRVSGLGGRMAPVLESGDHDCFASVASLWEISIKWRLGKLQLNLPPERLPELIGALGLAVLPIAAKHVLKHVEPEPATRDPFDRLLLAVCETENLRFVTIDRALVDHPLAVRI